MKEKKIFFKHYNSEQCHDQKCDRHVVTHKKSLFLTVHLYTACVGGVLLWVIGFVHSKNMVLTIPLSKHLQLYFNKLLSSGKVYA